MLKNKLALLMTVLTLALAIAAPAAAAPPRIDLRGETLGYYHLDEIGNAVLSGDVTGRPFDGAYEAMLGTADGTLPEPGECEPAVATMEVKAEHGRRRVALEAEGEVCGRWTDAVYVVSHSFTGIYVVTDATQANLRGTDGWIGVVLTNDGGANVEVFDS